MEKWPRRQVGRIVAREECCEGGGPGARLRLRAVEVAMRSRRERWRGEEGCGEGGWMAWRAVGGPVGPGWGGRVPAAVPTFREAVEGVLAAAIPRASLVRLLPSALGWDVRLSAESPRTPRLFRPHGPSASAGSGLAGLPQEPAGV